ncbi:MAG: hypothetical protein BGN86_12165 [Caulobacterales bacterium 68-7]|nr:MAG: hypothetical protein BGN86_12165 [Caulobacterales bacterium 68-7]
MLAPNPAETAPRDGRAIRGWFRWEGGAAFFTVSWSREKQAWVDLVGQPLATDFRLSAWGES